MKIKYISWLPAVIIMIMIFCFSSKPADNSNESSLKVTEEIINIYENITNTQHQETEKIELASTLNHYVRKGAHFCEYAILAAAIVLHLKAIRKKGKKLFFIPVFISFLYAAMDEFHQTFIPGRAGMIRDVLLDTTGAATGTILFIYIGIAFANFVKKHKKCATSL